MDSNDRMDNLVRMFVKVRDELAKRKEAYEESIKPLTEIKSKLEGRMLAFLDQSGQTSAKTQYGTCFTTVKDRASLADPDAFMAFVMKKGLFELLDRRANATAVKDFVENEGTLPPGVNFHSYKALSVRRS
jgi:hypothetical protein